MGKLKLSNPPSQNDLSWKNRNASKERHSNTSACNDSLTFSRDKLVVVRPPCPLTVNYAEEEEEEEEVSVCAEGEALHDQRKKDKRRTKKNIVSRRSSSERQSPRSERKESPHGKSCHTSESKGEHKEPYERRLERRRHLRERYMAKTEFSNSPLPPADMAWKDRKPSQQSHSHANSRTDSSTFVRAELAVVPPAPVMDAFYQMEFGAEEVLNSRKKEALYDKKKKDKKKKKMNKETRHSSSERQSSRWEHKERHHGKNGDTLDTKGEQTEGHEWRKQEEKNSELRKKHRECRESNKSSRNSKTDDEKHLEGYPLCTQPIEQPKGATKPAEVDCNRLLMQLIHAQREMLKAATGENNSAPPASHPLIVKWDQDFQEAFDAFTRDTTENLFQVQMSLFRSQGCRSIARRRCNCFMRNAKC